MTYHRYLPPIAAFFAFLLILVFILWSTHGVFRYHQSLKAQKQFNTLVTNESPFIWPFQDASDFIRGRKLIDPEFKDGHLSSASDDQGQAYFYLNLKGQLIDARRYDRLLINLYSQQAGQLSISFYSAKDRQIAYRSESIAIASGVQTLEVLLATIDWHPLGADINTVSPVKAWSQQNLGIRRLRLDWQFTEKTPFTLNRIELPSKEPRLRYESYPLPLNSQNLPQILDDLSKQRDTAPIISLDGGYLWPDFALWAIDQIQAVHPLAIVVPYPTDLTSFTHQSSHQSSDPTHYHYPWQKDAAWVINSSLIYSFLLFLFIVILLWQGLPWKTRPEKQQNIIEFMLLFSIAAIGLLLIPLLYAEHLLRYMLMTQLLVLGYLLNRQRFHSWQATGIQLATPKAWRDCALVSLPALILLLAIAIFAQTLFEPEPIQLAKDFIKYIIWGLIQQFIIGPLFAKRLFQASQSLAFSALCTASLFSFLHFPNTSLMVTTLIMGSLWTYLYLKHHTILPLAVSIGFLGVLYHELAPLYIRYTGDVGALYYAFMYL